MKVNFISSVSANKNKQQNPSFGYGILISSKDFYTARKIAKKPAIRKQITELEKFLKEQKPKLMTLMDELTKSPDVNRSEIPSINFGFKLGKKGAFNLLVKSEENKYGHPLEISDWFDIEGNLKKDESILTGIVSHRTQDSIDFLAKMKALRNVPKTPPQEEPKIIKIPYIDSPLSRAFKFLRPFVTIDEESYNRIVEQIFQRGK